jgi:protein tyrosine/serine phosphatase
MTMTTNGNQPGANIKIASLPNLRDLGGWATADGGHVRSGLLYRSVELGKLTDADMPKVDALGLRTIYDLRTKDERSALPDRLPSGANGVVCDVLADSPNAKPAQMLSVLSNDQLLPALQPVFDKFKSKGGDPDILRPVLGVEPKYLAAALDEMHTKFGTIEEYFANGLGIGADVQSSLRDALVEHS